MDSEVIQLFLMLVFAMPFGAGLLILIVFVSFALEILKAAWRWISR